MTAQLFINVLTLLLSLISIACSLWTLAVTPGPVRYWLRKKGFMR